MRFYNHIDLHELGEYEELADQLAEEGSSPKYHCFIERVSISSYRIFVDLPLFTNPVFKKEFKKAYRVGYVKATSPYKLVIHLSQPSYFFREVKKDLHFIFNDVMETMLTRSKIKAPVVTINFQLSKAS